MGTPHKSHKVVSTLPATLEPNSSYYVRVGTGFDLYVTNGTGAVAWPLNKTTTTIYTEVFAGGSTDGLTAGIWARNCTITKIGTPGGAGNLNQGRWQIVFDTAHPDGIQYAVAFSAEEPNTTRDNPKKTIEQGSKTANGFIFMTTTDDNGAGADPYNDQPWTFSVTGPTVVAV